MRYTFYQKFIIAFGSILINRKEEIEILEVLLKAVPELPLDYALCQPKGKGRSDTARGMNQVKGNARKSSKQY